MGGASGTNKAGTNAPGGIGRQFGQIAQSLSGDRGGGAVGGGSGGSGGGGGGRVRARSSRNPPTGAAAAARRIRCRRTIACTTRWRRVRTACPPPPMMGGPGGGPGGPMPPGMQACPRHARRMPRPAPWAATDLRPGSPCRDPTASCTSRAPTCPCFTSRTGVPTNPRAGWSAFAGGRRNGRTETSTRRFGISRGKCAPIIVRGSRVSSSRLDRRPTWERWTCSGTTKADAGWAGDALGRGGGFVRLGSGAAARSVGENRGAAQGRRAHRGDVRPGPEQAGVSDEHGDVGHRT